MQIVNPQLYVNHAIADKGFVSFITKSIITLTGSCPIDAGYKGEYIYNR